ncbi:acyltransferase [Spirosoma sp. SC4-14]|uniref:acyltransferase family protein n=1 Tax=Spirosoma sp. SC4-14 TaxID=3128900 RepID=UPI0030D30C98
MSTTLRHIKNLDGVRGIAALLVMLVHGGHGRFEGGWVGVDLFFVLSGYLITSLLQNEYQKTDSIDFRKFYARRALRLFPALLIGILLCNMIWPYWFRTGGGNRTIANLASLLYVNNCIPGNLSGPLGHLWSLSVEEHFYLFWPLIVSLFVFRIRFTSRLWFVGILIAVVSIFRIYVYRLGDPTFGLFALDSYRFTFCRIDAILLGSGLAIYLKHSSKPTDSSKASPVALICLLGLLAIVATTIKRDNVLWNEGGFILTDLICLLIVVTAIRLPDQWLLTNKLIRWVGTRSYGLYVYHIPIFFAFELFREPHSTSNLLIITVLRFAVSGLVAELSYRYIEQPILKHKKHFTVSSDQLALKPIE